MESSIKQTYPSTIQMAGGCCLLNMLLAYKLAKLKASSVLILIWILCTGAQWETCPDDQTMLSSPSGTH